MKLVFCFLLTLSTAKSQLIFSSDDKTEVPVAEVRLGLLGDSLGLSPTGDLSGSTVSPQDTTQFTTITLPTRPTAIPSRRPRPTTRPSRRPTSRPVTTSRPVNQIISDFTDLTGRVPSGADSEDQLCCVAQNQQCGDYLGRQDLVGQGIINARQKKKPEIQTRIVNIEGSDSQTSSQKVCHAGSRTCRYHSSVDLSSLGHTCQPQQEPLVDWSQGCTENVVQDNSGNQCGVRNFNTAGGLKHAETSPGEFPYTCLLLNQDNEFLGTCALIPSGSHNDNNRGDVKVITAAHKLKSLKKNDELVVRVGEYDASGFNPPETVRHQEYTVSRLLKHPQFNPRRLSNDIAILYTQKPIQLNNNVNTACLPSCRDQFSHKFSNGTGVRCWVAGWGKDETNGEFQFIQHKVDLPLVDDSTCNVKLKSALNQQKSGQGNRFSLSRSEICAGGEVGKDACTGDGGSPLVCQAKSGRWTVVGLVTWGVGCASHVPGVYARVSEFQRWIDAN